MTEKSCKKCGKVMEVAQDQFYWRGVWFSGLVCIGCKVLLENPDDSMFEYIKKQAAPETF